MPHWSADGKSIVVAVEDDRTVYVGRVAVASSGSAGAGPQPADTKVDALTSGRRVAGELSGGADGNWAVTVSTAGEPFEVYAFEKGALRRLTHHNDGWLADVGLGTTEDITFKAKDGTVVNGLLVKPPDYVAGQRYPTLLNIHGGPDGQDEHSFDFEREFLAANGYVVLQVNYRGGSGRGEAYQKAIYADWGHLEVVDLLAGVDYAVAQGLAAEDVRSRAVDIGVKGRGRALRQVWLASEAPLLAYMDADLSTGLDALPTMLDALAAGTDVVAGSRLLRNSRIARSLDRSCEAGNVTVCTDIFCENAVECPDEADLFGTATNSKIPDFFNCCRN